MRALSALFEATRRAVYFMIGLGKEKTTIQQSLAKWLRNNFEKILLGSMLVFFLIGEKYLYSLLSAVLAIIAAGPDAFLAFRFLKLVKIFSTPLDELAIGSLATVGFLIFLLYRSWNYLWSQYYYLKDSDED